MTATRPRIHWVSPLPPAETDIAHYTARLLPALAELADVVLWTDADAWDGTLERHATVRRFDPQAHAPLDLAALGGGVSAIEAVFLNIGNSWLFHAGILRIARQIPACVVLHDIGLQDLAWMMMDNGLMGHDPYRVEMARWYGPDGARAAERVLGRTSVPAVEAVRFPMFEIALPRAVSALVHTRSAFEAVAARDVLPAYQLDLPFDPGPPQSAGRDRGGPLRLVQFGYIAPNRRLDQVLDALAAASATVDFTFEIFGSLWDPAHVARRIGDLGLGGRVRIRGFVPEADLDAALSAAHLVFNLRAPTMGEASGSQLRIWRAAAASVVTDHGWYADLPEGTAFKVARAGDRRSLAELLGRIATDRGLVEEVGAAGRARLEAVHRTEHYARGLIEIAGRHRQDAREALLARALGDQVSGLRRRRDRAAAQLARLIDEASD